MAFSSTFGGPRANISLFHLLARVTVNIHVILRKMAKPREKVRNAMLHNYDSARYLACKVKGLRHSPDQDLLATDWPYPSPDQNFGQLECSNQVQTQSLTNTSRNIYHLTSEQYNSL